MAQNSVLVLRNIRYSYKLEGQSVPVLNDLSFEIQPGELVAIQGPSGSGKSTLLYLLGCLLKPDSGEVHVGGENVALLNSDELAFFRNRNIGFIFQQFHLLPRSTILENILLPSHYPAESKSVEPDPELTIKAKNLAESLGLGDRLHHKPNELSGGQQQRVAIARALMNDTKIILADEPTGNLDSKTSEEILSLFRELNRHGRTVVIITHDDQVAKSCDRIIHIKDGKVTSEENLRANTALNSAVTLQIAKSPSIKRQRVSPKVYWRLFKSLIPLAIDNLKRNKWRSALTMLGVVIGVAAVMAMLTLGQFTKSRILNSYAELGVNTFTFYGHSNWRLKATDQVGVLFRAFNYDEEIEPLKKLFPEIRFLSPLLRSWNPKVTFAGVKVESDVTLIGVNEFAVQMTQRSISRGRNFSDYHIENRSPVCLLGFELAEQLFQRTEPIGQIVSVEGSDSSFGCQVIAVLAKTSSRKEWSKPNFQVIIPYTYFQSIGMPQREREIDEFIVEARPNTNIEDLGKKLKAYFTSKYGKTGIFRADSDSVLIAQMNKFLNLFSLMLGSIALLSLLVGGIGIANMMLVSVNERYREIGLRKALGATDLSVRIQFITESVLLCAVAGLIGVFLGFVTYEAAIYAASYVFKQLEFEWTIDIFALFFALVSIGVVGVLSGLAPAMRAEKLQVIEALRSE